MSRELVERFLRFEGEEVSRADGRMRRLVFSCEDCKLTLIIEGKPLAYEFERWKEYSVVIREKE